MRIGSRIAAGVSALAGVLLSASIAQAQEFKLRWGHYLGNSPFLTVEQNFAKAIEERTKGRVKIEISRHPRTVFAERLNLRGERLVAAIGFAPALGRRLQGIERRGKPPCRCFDRVCLGHDPPLAPEPPGAMKYLASASI